MSTLFRNFGWRSGSYPSMPTFKDARLWQFSFQVVTLGGGAWLFDFSLQAGQVLAAIAGGVAAQVFWIRLLRLKNVGIFSGVVTCFGLSLLLRSGSLWPHAAAAAVAVTTKFLFRVRGRHFFNFRFSCKTASPATSVSPEHR